MTKRLTVLSVFACMSLIFVISFFVVPCRMRVSVQTDNLYKGVSVTKKDLKVEIAPAIGSWKETSDFRLQNVSDRQLLLQKRWLSRSVQVDKVPVSFIAAEYRGVIHQFDNIDLQLNDFKVQATYANKHIADVDTFEIEQKKVDDKKSDIFVTVTALGESYDVVVHPVSLLRLDVSYQDGLHIGDEFDKSKMEVAARFSDGMTRKLDDWTCSFEGVVKADSKIEVISKKYGQGVLQIDMSNIKDYKLSYTRTIYAGDVLTSKDVKLTIIYTNGETKDVTNLSFNDVQVFVGTKVMMKSDLFGTLTCVVNPSKVKKVSGDCASDMNGRLTVRGITFVYDDGHQQVLDMKDVKFVTDLSKKLSVGQHEIIFQWFGQEYRFPVRVMG